jgi:hypothetical protein
MENCNTSGQYFQTLFDRSQYSSRDVSALALKWSYKRVLHYNKVGTCIQIDYFHPELDRLTH